MWKGEWKAYVLLLAMVLLPVLLAALAVALIPVFRGTLP